MSDQERVKRFLDSQHHLVLAVVLSDDTPWAVPVKIQRRDGFSVFEWDSRLDTVHSQALHAHPDSAITIFQKEKTQQICFCATGCTELVTDRGDGYGRYRFTVSKAWINDESFVKRAVQLEP